MNKRKEPTTAREARKSRNEVRRGIRQETPTPKKPIQAKVAAKSKAVIRKHSKRTSPKEKIAGSAPAHLNTENEHWLVALSKQTLLKARTLTRRLTKKH
jgi:hypothetical protein